MEVCAARSSGSEIKVNILLCVRTLLRRGKSAVAVSRRVRVLSRRLREALREVREGPRGEVVKDIVGGMGI